MSGKSAGGRRPYFGLTRDESDYARSKVVVLPVPYAGTVTYGLGTDRGPEAIRVASQQVELFDEETRRQPYKVGIHSAPPVPVTRLKPDAMVRKVKERVERYLDDDKFVVTLGGEHSISEGVTGPYAERIEGLTIVHFDAHSDLREAYEGTKHNHACAGARMREHARLIQIGIRSQCPEERAAIDRGEVETLFAYQMQDGDWGAKVLAGIPPRTPVYVTVDLDYFDPSIMPSTGTPEPGGGEWYPTLRFLKLLSEKTRIVGFDIMELAPIRGLHAPDFLAARLMYKMLAYAFPRALSMLRALLLAASGASAGVAAAAGAPGGDPDRFRTSLPALLIAGLLIVVALYLTIRLLEWDLINKDTEDQDDPLHR